jgi:hypothetical protein
MKTKTCGLLHRESEDTMLLMLKELYASMGIYAAKKNTNDPHDQYRRRSPSPRRKPRSRSGSGGAS